MEVQEIKGEIKWEEIEGWGFGLEGCWGGRWGLVLGVLYDLLIFAMLRNLVGFSKGNNMRSRY